VYGWVIVGRQLLEIIETYTYQKPSDLLGLLPLNMPDCFTTGDIAREGKIPHWLAQKMAYSLRNKGASNRLERKDVHTFTRNRWVRTLQAAKRLVYRK